MDEKTKQEQPISEQLDQAMETLAKEPAPRQLSPDEEADLLAKRQLFRQLHDLIANKGVYEAEATLGSLTGVVNNAFTALQAQTKVGSLEIKSSDEKEQEIINLLADCDVGTALIYFQALCNAINHHKVTKTKDWTVGSLDIELL